MLSSQWFPTTEIPLAPVAQQKHPMRSDAHGQREILALLPATRSEIVEATGKTANTVSTMLYRLSRKGWAKADQPGRYARWVAL